MMMGGAEEREQTVEIISSRGGLPNRTHGNTRGHCQFGRAFHFLGVKNADNTSVSYRLPRSYVM